MNIFVLDLDFKKCAKYHVDKHVVKMCVEYAQLLCSAHHIVGNKDIPYRLSHKNHPCSVWVRECIENYVWLCNLALEICKEYSFRYNKIHKSQKVIEWAIDNVPKLPKNGKTSDLPIVVPSDCKYDDVVKSYKSYYCKHKKHIAFWKNRNNPSWFF